MISFRPSARRLLRAVVGSVWAFLALGICAGRAMAYELPPQTGFVVDQTGRLSNEEKARLEALLVGLAQEGEHPVSVLLAAASRTDRIEDIADAAFSGWQLGRPGENDGVLLIVVESQWMARLERGNDAMRDLTDEDCHEVFNKVLLDPLIRGETALGIERGVREIAGTMRAHRVARDALRTQLMGAFPTSAARTLSPWFGVAGGVVGTGMGFRRPFCHGEVCGQERR